MLQSLLRPGHGGDFDWAREKKPPVRPGARAGSQTGSGPHVLGHIYWSQSAKNVSIGGAIGSKLISTIRARWEIQMPNASARTIVSSLVFLTFLLLISSPAQAVPPLEQWLSPTLGNLETRISYSGVYYPTSDLDKQDADMSITVHGVRGLTPVYQSKTDELVFVGRFAYANIDTKAILPDTGRKMPNDFWDLNAGARYRHSMGDGWLWGAFLGFGSPSNKPFNSFDETDVNLTAFLRMPHGKRNAWLFLLNYTNNRDFLSGAPIPGLAYLYNPSHKFTAILGAPLLSLKYTPLPEWSFTLYYMYPRNIDARITWLATRRVHFYTGFDWSNYRYYLADRAHRENRLFYFQKRGFIGSRVIMGHGFRLALETGLSFDRLFFEGENYGDRHQDRIDLENSWFVAFSLGVAF